MPDFGQSKFLTTVADVSTGPIGVTTLAVVDQVQMSHTQIQEREDRYQKNNVKSY